MASYAFCYISDKQSFIWHLTPRSFLIFEEKPCEIEEKPCEIEEKPCKCPSEEESIFYLKEIF